MAGRPPIKHASPVVLDVVNNGIGKSHARIVNNIAHGTRAGNVLRGSNICCKGRRDDQERLPYFADHHGYHLPAFRVLAAHRAAVDYGVPSIPWQLVRTFCGIHL